MPTPQSFNSGLSPSACSRGVSRPFRIFQRLASGNAVGRPASGPAAACRDFYVPLFCQVPVIYFALSLHPMELGSVSSGRIQPCSTQGLPAWRRYSLSPCSSGLLGKSGGEVRESNPGGYPRIRAEASLPSRTAVPLRERLRTQGCLEPCLSSNSRTVTLHGAAVVDFCVALPGDASGRSARGVHLHLARQAQSGSSCARTNFSAADLSGNPE